MFKIGYSDFRKYGLLRVWSGLGIKIFCSLGQVFVEQHSIQLKLNIDSAYYFYGCYTTTVIRPTTGRAWNYDILNSKVRPTIFNSLMVFISHDNLMMNPKPTLVDR